MKTEVEMKRELFGIEIRQKSKSTFFSATDMVKAGNILRERDNLGKFNATQWLRSNSTMEFIEALKEKYDMEVVVVSGRGGNRTTWVHPLLFIDMALAISPKLKIEVYEWLYDNLIANRNESGDSYKEMTGYLFDRHGSVKTFPAYMTMVAMRIRKACGIVGGPDAWQNATEGQLKLRDDIHRSIGVLANTIKNNNTAVECGIKFVVDKIK